jgi:hypothetical protein
MLDRKGVPMPTAPRGEKRAADVIGVAVMVAGIATGEITEGLKEPGKFRSGHAGATARANKSSREGRSAIAKNAAARRLGVAQVTNVEESDLNAKMFAAALNSPVPRVYLNGFLLGQSFSDITVVGQTNGNPSTVLNMSFTTAKSLAIELDKIIKKFEETTGHTLLTMEDIGTKMV